MESVKNLYSDIDYESKNVMEQISKHFKDSDERLLEKMEKSIESVAKSMESIQKSHTVCLEVNEALVMYIVELQKKKKEKIYEEAIAIENLEERLRKPQSEISESPED